MNAIVTLVSGAKYRSQFAKYCYPNWKSYADRHGLELLIYDDLLDRSPRGLARSPAWQKCLILDHEKARKYDQVAWLDSDIVINASKAPNIFDGVDRRKIGAVMDYAYPTPDKYRERLERIYRLWDAVGIQYIDNKTPQLFSSNWGLPPTDEVVQTGVLVATPELHGSIFRNTYERYEDKGPSYWSYEMRPLSYEILTRSPVQWLDLRFNVVTLSAATDTELEVIQSPPSLLERVVAKFRFSDVSLPIPRHKTLTRIHQRLLNDSYFLHFAGHQNFMKFLKAS